MQKSNRFQLDLRSEDGLLAKTVRQKQKRLFQSVLVILLNLSIQHDRPILNPYFKQNVEILMLKVMSFCCFSSKL